MLTENQLRSQISSIRLRSTSESSVIGISVPSRWAGQSQLHVDGNSYRLIAADTELELRAALVEPLPEGMRPVVLTTLDAKDLGEDLLYRFARRRIHTLTAKDVLCELFKVREIDPQLHALKWMASALADARPEGGYSPPPQGTLDQETAWGAFLQRKLGMETARPDLPALIVWARLPQNVEHWRKLEPDAAAATEKWITRFAGVESGLVWAALRRNTEVSVFTLGLVASLLFRRGDLPPEIAVARGSFEARYFEGIHLTASEGRAYANATLSALRSLDANKSDIRNEIDHADSLLKSLRIEDRALESEVSLLGWAQRITVFSQTLRTWIKSRLPADLTQLAVAYKAIEQHRSAALEQITVEQLQMALRLCRWLTQQASGKTSVGFASSCQAYVENHCFVDWARYTLFHGHSHAELNLACEELVTVASELRERFNQTFAEALYEWTAAGSSSSEVGLIEAVLSERVAPLAKTGGVLMVVLDGLSFPIYRQIAAELVRDKWAEAVPTGQSQSIPVIAGLPTVTEWSRRLLLSGRTDLAPGADETAAFRDAPAFKGLGRTNSPPLLFRKNDLTDFGGRSVSDIVRKEIMSPSRQVVGIVINAIDDHLAKDDQLRVAWPIAQIPILQQVLELARIAGRYLIITSDHGHVVTHRAQRIIDAPNDRYRLPMGQPMPGELHLRQGRGGTFSKEGVFVPWTERGYYTSRRNGLHGGIAPQEVLVPATVFVSGSQVPEGWNLIPQRYPDWWWESQTTASAPAQPPATPAPASKKTKAVIAAEATLPLFAGVAAPQAVDWIDALFTSPLYREQYTRVGRNPPNPETVKRVLVALKERQCTVLKSVLAQCSGEPEIRLPGLLAMLRRILNVEGYPVLSVDEASGTVRLNLDLLRTQFDLPAV